MAVALVTGTSTGIGRAIAELLAQRGFRVFGTVRRLDAVGPPGVERVAMDVRDDASVQSAISSVLTAASRIDVLVNNAGIGISGAVEETTVAEAQTLFDTNFFGALRVISAVLPHMRTQGGGRIVNVGSVASFSPMPFEAMYAATKHALAGLSESLDHEVRPFGVRSVLVQPGYIRSDIVRNTLFTQARIDAYEKGRRGAARVVTDNVTGGDNPVRVAEVVYRAATARSPRLKYVAGRGAGVLWLLRRFAPAALFDAGLRRHFKLDAPVTAQSAAKRAA